MIEILAIYGVCFGLMNDKLVLVRLVRKVDAIDRMLDCAYCTGFHSGWIVRLACDLLDGSADAQSIPVEMGTLLLWGFAGSAFCYGLDTLIKKLESHIPVEET